MDLDFVERPSPNCDERQLPVSMIVLHYTGMAAFEIQGRIVWDPALVAASIALGGLIGSASLPVGLRGDALKWKLFGRFVYELLFDEDHAGHHHRLRFRARRGQAAFYEQLIDALALHARHRIRSPTVKEGIQPARYRRRF